MNNATDIITGKNPIIEALKAGRPLNKILLSVTIRRDVAVSEIVRRAKERKVPVEFVDRHAIQRHNPGGEDQGAIAFAAAKDYVSLPDLLKIPKNKGEAPLFCILDGIEDPMNLGAILRSAWAAGIHGVIIRSRRAVGLTPTVSKASAGAIEHVPVCRVSNLTQAMDTLKENGIWITGIDMADGVDFEKVDYTAPTAIVIGGEGQGLSPLVKKKCDNIGTIPMKSGVNSLNASVAAALAMYAAFRVRHKSAPIDNKRK